MKINLKFLCLGAVLCTAAFAQVSSSDGNTAVTATTTSTLPVAYVYVAITPKNVSNNEVWAYAAAANGKLTAVPGSPFQDNVTNMAVNEKYLFGTSKNGIDIDSYRIKTDGALTYLASTDVTKYNNDPNSGSAGPLFLDHTGATLYDMEFDGNNGANNVYQSFAVEKATGGLKFLGYAQGGASSFSPIEFAASFIGDNVYAYTSTDDNCMYYAFWGFKRNSSGLLSGLDINPSTPKPATGAAFRAYVPSQAAADPTNHVAIVMQPASPPGCAAGELQLATYTAASNGNLTTTSTGANMPKTSVTNVNDLKMAPSGKLLAVGGTGGLQIFHFNGASPITHYTGLLTTDTINEMFWDNNNHLYAISTSAGKLFVFTVTTTSYSQATGSPYTISDPQNIIVQPLTK
jgi:FlaG/FlaF family flagellin (archaellin)